ncbi:MAG: CPBP family intramembrane metalloprotease [Anaerolineales bacterium]|nr:CPBP family intramembrane metalloprotease [Anaerolineales bacterium]
MESIGLGLGNTTWGIRFILAAAAFFLLSSLLNLAFGLGSLQTVHEMVMGIPIPSPFYIPALLLLFFAVTMIGGPLSGLSSTFGEEYGWCRFLLDELRPMGFVAASFLSGLIWGIWHIPVILRGIHTYPPTAAGILAGLIFFTLWGVLQSYAALKTGSIWTAAFMHGVVNSVYAFTLTYLVRPETALSSFGLGWYGLGVLGVLVIFALRDPIFHEKAVQSSPRHA